MLSEDKYFKDLTEAELWQRYCGFLDLTIDEFMAMQEELLMDQIDRVAGSILGEKIMNNHRPKSVEEFRRMVPLTTYDDYEPYLSEQREDVLAIKPDGWVHSSGRGGNFKWVPWGQEFVAKLAKCMLSGFILSLTKQKGRVNIYPGFRFLLLLPAAPYASGYLFQSLIEDYFSFQAIPPLETAERMEFQDRIKEGFQRSLRDGVDAIAALSSVLVRIGEEFSGEARSMKLSASMLHPKIVCRLLGALLRSKRERRKLLPKDLWPAKGILTGGADTAIYRDAIVRYWGNDPLEFYGGAESGLIATQAWNKKMLTMLPDLAFLEFIPDDELLKEQNTLGYQPSTVLLDALQVGKSYEIVVTQLYGMPLLRYRLRDIVKVIALSDDESGVKLPQIVFQHRLGETIKLAGLAELDEKVIWQAIANTGIKYTEWAACKEFDHNQAFIRIYLELKQKKKAAEIASDIDQQLRLTDTDYRDIDSYLKFQPVRVTLLEQGTFQRYMDEKRKEGADLAHTKPSHINAPPSVIERLLELSQAIEE